jgi:predicted phage tail protein
LFDMAGNVKQGLTAGVIIALVTSVVVGVTAESFWMFLAALGFSMLCVGAAHMLVVAARPRRVESDH